MRSQGKRVAKRSEIAREKRKGGKRLVQNSSPNKRTSFKSLFSRCICCMMFFAMLLSPLYAALGFNGGETEITHLYTDGVFSNMPIRHISKEDAMISVAASSYVKQEMKKIQEERKAVKLAAEEEAKRIADEEASRLYWEKLEEMKNDPLTPTLDFLPYLQGDFETNVLNMAKVMHIESGGASDEEQQMQGLVLVNRCFHPRSFSDGKGNILSAIFHTGQYPWTTECNFEDIVPDEQSIRNARAVLTGNVLDTENIRGVTRNVEYANTSPLGYATYCKIWNAPCEKWVYFDYGW